MPPAASIAIQPPVHSVYQAVQAESLKFWSVSNSSRIYLQFHTVANTIKSVPPEACRFSSGEAYDGDSNRRIVNSREPKVTSVKWAIVENSL